MKRYLVTITGRANLGYKGNKLRERDLCCSYVYGKNMAEAISKFWEQIKESSGLKGFERRDFKITAERWEKEADLDVNGNPLEDLEWAIPFDLLASVELMHDEHFKNYKLDLPESLNEPQESSEPVAQENIQPEPEDATESISEPQEDADAQEREKEFQRELAKIRKRKEKLIPREMIEAYNRLSDSLKGTTHHAILKMYHEYKDVDGKFKGLSWGLPRDHMITIDGEEFYIKKIKHAVWLYWEFRGDVERWLLTDQAKAYFNIENESNPEPSHSSSEEEKEITQENTEELTEGKPEPQGMAHHTRIKLNFSLSALRAKRKELARIQWHEYTTRGNTEKCQSLFKQIEAIDEEIARRENT